MTINGQFFDMKHPLVVGIINATPDSFYNENRATNEKAACQLAEKQLLEGASWIDLGAVSTRPGAEIVSEKEEETRLIPILKVLRKWFEKTIISVDTSSSKIAKIAVKEGASVINDVTGGMGDDQMISTVAEMKVPYIAMHSRGNSLTMTELTQYNLIPEDIIEWFKNRILLYENAGIKDIIVDPGIGFAKNSKQNFEIINGLSKFNELEKPILIGISRKRFIYNSLDISIENSLNGTTAMHMACLMNGANLLRVHDVKEAVETVKLYTELTKFKQ